MLKMLTFKHWTDSAPYTDTATTLILTERQFHVEEGETFVIFVELPFRRLYNL